MRPRRRADTACRALTNGGPESGEDFARSLASDAARPTGLEDIFQNLLAGILILLREPFRVGDEIVSGDFVGTVEAIETRATFTRTYDGRRVIIPTSQVYSDPVQVITAYHMV